MQLIIHRGTREIGGSCVELKTEKAHILIDFGMPLVDTQEEPFDAKTLVGKSIEDLKKIKILPNIYGLYQGEQKNIDAILISHSHVDHYGLLRYIRKDIPIYLSKGAKEIVEISELFTPFKVGKLNIKLIDSKREFNIKDIKITPYLVDHSAFDALAFLIEAEHSKIFYSGDFRGHGRKSALFNRIVKRPPKDIDCLIMEGTSLGKNSCEYKSETAVQAKMEEILRANKRPTFLFVSSQNIDRLVSAYKSCRKTNSLFIIDIYTAFILEKLSKVSKNIPQHNWRNVRLMLSPRYAEILKKAGYAVLLSKYAKRSIDIFEISLKKNRMLIIARDNHDFRRLTANYDIMIGATVIYSLWEGYITDSFKRHCTANKQDVELIHASGHATVEDLRAFAGALNPKMLIPIHTFHADRYRGLFRNVKKLEDGEPITIFH